MGGGGTRGSSRTTDESTLGGGLKLLRPTCSAARRSGSSGQGEGCGGGVGGRKKAERRCAAHALCLQQQRACCKGARLKQVADARQQLRVDGEAGVERVGGLGRQAHRKLVLVHDDRGAEGGAVRQQAEGEGGGDVVGDVGDHQVEEGQVHLAARRV